MAPSARKIAGGFPAQFTIGELANEGVNDLCAGQSLAYRVDDSPARRQISVTVAAVFSV